MKTVWLSVLSVLVVVPTTAAADFDALARAYALAAAYAAVDGPAESGQTADVAATSPAGNAPTENYQPVANTGNTLVADRKAKLAAMREKQAEMAVLAAEERAEMADVLAEKARNFEVPEEILRTLLHSVNRTALIEDLDPSITSRVEHFVDDPVLNAAGIKQLIGVGMTDFYGSADERVDNIFRTVQLLDTHIIPQGETFSFNREIGPVTLARGFKESLVILGDEVKPGLGGGVCQTSTTIYRAAFSAGLPITQHHFHSKPVPYYGPQYGTDATIWQPGKDFRFQNDTPGDVMVQIGLQDRYLIILLYGTPDRQVTIDEPKFSGTLNSGLGASWTRRVNYDDGESYVDTRSTRYGKPDYGN